MKGKPLVLSLIKATGMDPAAFFDEHYYKEGCNLSTACAAIGLQDKRTLWNWMRNNGFKTKPQSECQTGALNGFYGKTHSQDSRGAIGRKSSVRNSGAGNPSSKKNGHASHQHYRRAVVGQNPSAACEHCGETHPTHQMDVHHKNKDRRDNSPENLQLLCERCHYRIHALERRRAAVARSVARLKAMEDEFAALGRAVK